tara:strand:+ start:3181 stop:3843 length:663 start_codon:yes stop_codon:yes gene_type:complete
MENKNTTILLISNGNGLNLLDTLKGLMVSNTARPIIDKLMIILREDDDVELFQELDRLKHGLKEVYDFKILKPSAKNDFERLDYALSLINTKYIFYCSAGWGFIGKHYIYRSIYVLESQKDTIQVLLNNTSEFTPNKVMEERHQVGDMMYVSGIRTTKVNYNNKEHLYNGFNLTTGLFRTSDLKAIGRFSRFSNIYEVDTWYKKQNKIILTFTEEYTKPI